MLDRLSSELQRVPGGFRGVSETFQVILGRFRGFLRGSMGLSIHSSEPQVVSRSFWPFKRFAEGISRTLEDCTDVQVSFSGFQGVSKAFQWF